MEDQNVGGSYIRQKDGSLKLVERTEAVTPEWVAEDAGAPPAAAVLDTPAEPPAASKKKGE